MSPWVCTKGNFNTSHHTKRVEQTHSGHASLKAQNKMRRQVFALELMMQQVWGNVGCTRANLFSFLFI